MVDQRSADFDGLISREHAENAFRAALNLFVGRGRLYSVDQCHKGSRVPKRLIECCKSYPVGHTDYRPLDFGQRMSLAKFLGADFTNEWLRLADQGAFDLPDDEPDPGELLADTSEDTAKLARMAADGDLRNDSPEKLRTTGARMMANGAKLVAVAANAA